MSRAVRPRPLDPTKKLLIVRDPALLDQVAAGDVSGMVGPDQANVAQGGGAGMGGQASAHNPAHTAAGTAQTHTQSHVSSSVKKKPEPIPTPKIHMVPTYAKDYRPDFKQPQTYLRWRQNLRSEFHIEYDLDAEDSRWLDEYNGGQQRLSADKMELMMWKLEVLNARATERALDKAGATPTEKNSAAAAATTDHLTQQEAIMLLVAQTGLRDKVCETIYKYWKAKRKKRGKPLLRHLEAPTNPQDTNPFHVFRPREKQHRPQTRRRRENDVRSYERLKEIRENLVSAASIMEAVMAREAKKREIVQHEVDEQRLQLRLHRAEATAHDGIAAEMLSALKDRARRAMLDDSGPRRGHDDGMDGRRGAPMGIPRGGRRGGLRISLSRRSPLHAVADLGPGPLPPEPMALFGDEGMDVDLERVEKAMLVGLPKGIPRSAVRARFGRGGRLVLDRCDPLTGVLYGEAGGGGEPMEVDS